MNEDDSPLRARCPICICQKTVVYVRKSTADARIPFLEDLPDVVAVFIPLRIELDADALLETGED